MIYPEAIHNGVPQSSLAGRARILSVALRKDDALLGDDSRSIARRSGRSPTNRSR